MLKEASSLTLLDFGFRFRSFPRKVQANLIFINCYISYHFDGCNFLFIFISYLRAKNSNYSILNLLWNHFEIISRIIRIFINNAICFLFLNHSNSPLPGLNSFKNVHFWKVVLVNCF